MSYRNLVRLAVLSAFALTPVVLASPTGAEVTGLQSVASANAMMCMADTIPIRVDVSPNTVTNTSGTIQCTVTVDQVPAGGGTVQVNTDRPDVLVSPTGSWPYNLYLPPGSAPSATFSISTRFQSSSTTANIGSCQTGLDSSDPANWQASTSVSYLMPLGPPL